MDRLKQIESFTSVATKGSLTSAAKAEGVAPAVIGRRGRPSAARRVSNEAHGAGQGAGRRCRFRDSALRIN